MKTTNILTKKLEEFDKTKFATGGGSSFECSDYEGMYVELKSFLRTFYLEIIESVGEKIIDDIQKQVVKLSTPQGQIPKGWTEREHIIQSAALGHVLNILAEEKMFGLKIRLSAYKKVVNKKEGI